jgi:hypothetical protein
MQWLTLDVKDVVNIILRHVSRGKSMDNEATKVASTQIQNYGSTGIAALLMMFGLGDVPFELVDKWFHWYMGATREELIKTSILILAAVVCWLYKRPNKKDSVITLTERVEG